MKALSLTILSVLSLYYQTLVLNEVSFVYFIPNIIVSLLIFSHFYLHINFHTFLFFLIGLAMDCNNPPLFGIYTFSFMTLSYLITLIKNHIDLDIFANKIAMISLSNAAFYILFSLMSAIVYKQSYLEMAITFIVSSALNTLLSFLVISLLDFLRMLKFDPTNE